MRATMRILGLAAAMMALGCGVEGLDDSDISADESASTMANGTSMNGTSMNGTSMNGVSMNGVSMNGTSMNGTSMNGVSMNGIVGVGAQFYATTPNGTLTIRIDGIEVAPDPDPATRANENDDILLYTVTYWGATCRMVLVNGVWTRSCSYSWRPICPYTDFYGKYNKAIPINGRWGQTNPGGKDDGTDGVFSTFACRDSAMAKCAERLAYKPWDSAYLEDVNSSSSRSISMDAYHQACVRMIRADYCGDGVAHTTDGNYVDVWDGLNLNQQSVNVTYGSTTPTTDTLYRYEGQWLPTGSKCVSTTRWQWSSTNPDGTTASWFKANSACPSPLACSTLGTYLTKTCPSKIYNMKDLTYDCKDDLKLQRPNLYAVTPTAYIANSTRSATQPTQ